MERKLNLLIESFESIIKTVSEDDGELTKEAEAYKKGIVKGVSHCLALVKFMYELNKVVD